MYCYVMLPFRVQNEAEVDKASSCTCLSLVVFRTLAEMAAATSVHVVAIIEPIIQHADWFFPEGKTSRFVVFAKVLLLSLT